MYCARSAQKEFEINQLRAELQHAGCIGSDARRRVAAARFGARNGGEKCLILDQIEKNIGYFS
jgi:hypothetical protein